MLDHIVTLDGFTTLLTLTGLEVVLGIDNIVFISLLSSKLPKPEQKPARRFGLGLALVLRVMLLFFASFIAQLKEPLFFISEYSITGRMLLFLFGGIFLIYKGIKELNEMWHETATTKSGAPVKVKKQKFSTVIFQIAMIDLVLSLDSVITAVGLTDNMAIIIIAIAIAILTMLLLADKVTAYIKKHPSIKIIAIAIVILVGFYLTVKGLRIEIDKNYLNFAIFFCIFVEALNISYRNRLLKQTQGHKSK
ncbi:MAG: TerC family protein [Pseudomonadota bacterium]